MRVDADLDSVSPTVMSAVAQVTSNPRDTKCQKLLWSLVSQQVNPVLTPEQKEEFLVTLEKNHEAFTLEEGERGETSLVEMEIDTGEPTP